MCLLVAVLPDGVTGRPAVLVGLAVALGVHAAVSSPATVTFSRLLSTDESFPRLLAAEQVAGQVALVAGRVLGGALVGVGGLALAATVPAAAAVVCVLVVGLVLTGVVRPDGSPVRGERPTTRRRPTTPGGATTPEVPTTPEAPTPPVALPSPEAPPPPEFPTSRGRRALAVLGGGVRAIAADPVLRPFVLLTAVVAGTVIPATGVGLALLLVERGADAGALGLLGAGGAAGVACVALVVAVRGRWRRTGLVVVAGAVVAGCGLVGLALAPSDAVRAAGAVVVGLGQGLFATHGAPLVRRVPVGVLGRVQAAQGALQALAIAGGSAALAASSATWGAGPSVVGAGVVAALAAVAAAASGFWPVEPYPAELRPAELRPAEPRPAEPRPAEPRPASPDALRTSEPLASGRVSNQGAAPRADGQTLGA